MPRAMLALCCALVCSATLAVPVAAAPDPPAYRPPVDAPVRDPFRPPAIPYGPGNRGLEYDTAAGDPVAAAADGRVSFSGAVGGTLHVTVLHPDGVRTSYSFLAQIDVVAGQRVRRGQVLGFTSGSLHFGARRGEQYFDPASLFEGGPPQVHLVPFDEPPGAGPAGERRAISQLVGGLDGLVHRFGGPAGAVGSWVRDGGTQLIRSLEHYGSRLTFPAMFLDTALTGWRVWERARRAAARPCTDADVEPESPPERRVAVLVGGLGSSSTAAAVDAVDAAGLGYDGADVVRFSYAGGRVPDGTDGLRGLAASPYSPEDTWGDLRAAAVRLADLVEGVTQEAPGVPIDLYAHSQGGLLARWALIELEARHGAGWLDVVGLVATLGTPHGGADLATGLHALSSTGTGDRVLDAAGLLTTTADAHESTAVGQLSETSDLVATLADHPVPSGIAAVSIAARGDLVVPVPRTAAPGMEQVVVPIGGSSAHRDLPGSPAANRELGLALAGLPPTCQALRDALLDHSVGEGISLLEDAASGMSFLAAAYVDVRGA